MRVTLILIAGLVPVFAAGQAVSSVYNRDTHEPFRLKNMKVESTVVGPLVKTSTVLTYENPYKTLTEATLNFELSETAALGGFAYFYGDEYVRGRLMDKNKAWFIYTAITSRGRDPGIMEQWSSTFYHCQIYPIKTGSDLKVRLWTVGLLKPDGGTLTVPKPTAPRAVGYERKDGTLVEPSWSVRGVQTVLKQLPSGSYHVNLPSGVSAVSQRFSDGRVYVAGIVRGPIENSLMSGVPLIHVESAYYEPWNGTAGADVTARVAGYVAGKEYSVRAENEIFGDPTPNVFKRLRVAYSVNGVKQAQTVQEHEIMNLLSPSGRASLPDFPLLRETKFITMAPQTIAFFGWMPRSTAIKMRYEGKEITFRPRKMVAGNDTARLWAQQALRSDHFANSKDLLKFSLKYGVPSGATALLAVPSSEMDSFRKKEKEWQADQRRQELEAARNKRAWDGQRNQNSLRGGGGDPEIRVTIPGAQSVEAILPDRRVLSLQRQGDTWGGNFEIPADAREGTYRVQVIGHMPDGSTVVRSWTYDVDRTPPKGEVRFLTESGRLVLQVKSEPGLNEVTLYASDGRHWRLREETPGVYRIVVPDGVTGSLVVVLKDGAGNKSVLTCLPPR